MRGGEGEPGEPVAQRLTTFLFTSKQIGKRFVLLLLEVAPDRVGEQQLWDSAGPENKIVPLDVWQAIYRKLGELCRKQFGEAGKSVRAIVDKEYLYRLEERPFFVVRYEFKDENYRDNLNIIFNENGKKLHPGCLVVRIKDESLERFQEMQEQGQKIEKLQKENEALLALSASQEYTPAPVKSSSSSTSHSEYVPTALNGTSPENTGRYKPSRIEDTVKCVPDPYTPSSSQEDSNSVAYVPATVKTPRKKKGSPGDAKPIVVSSSSESRKPAVCKRRRQAEIFGNSDDDDEEEESDLPSRFTPVAKRNSREAAKSNGNMSDENLFSEESPAKELIGSSSDEVPTNGRTMRDRKPKNNIDYNLDITLPESKDNASSSQTSKKAAGAGGKRRRKETAKPKLNESLDGWLQKDTKKPTIKKEAGGESSKPAKEKKAVKKEVPVIRQPVDREALKKENEAVRQQIAALDKIDLMLPEDKTLLDVPYL